MCGLRANQDHVTLLKDNFFAVVQNGLKRTFCNNADFVMTVSGTKAVAGVPSSVNTFSEK